MTRNPFHIRIDPDDNTRWVCRGPTPLWQAERPGDIEAVIANARYGEGLDDGADEMTRHWLNAITGTNDETKILRALVAGLFKGNA